MNPSTPISLQKKIDYLKQKIDQIYTQINEAQQQGTMQNLRIRFITLLDDNIDKIQIIQDSQKFNSLFYAKKSIDLNGYQSKRDQNKILTLEKQNVQLQKKLITYRANQLKQQQIVLQKQKDQLQFKKHIESIQADKQKLLQKISQLGEQTSYLKQKIQKQQQQIYRVQKMLQKSLQEVQKTKIQRNRAQTMALQLQNRPQPQVESHSNIYKSSESLRCVRIFTNLSSKKPHQRYVLLELPLKLEIQKIVYGIRMGILLSNKEILYFDEVFLYQKDMMMISKEGETINVDYVKRKQRITLDKYKVNKSQILLMLYGKGDSILVDQTK